MRIALALLFAALPAHAQMYKCVDERGVTHYSDKPRPGCKGGEVDIRPIPPAGGEVRPRTEDWSERDRDFRRRQIQQEQAVQKDRAAGERRCAEVRQRIASLEFGGRVYTVGPKAIAPTWRTPSGSASSRSCARNRAVAPRAG